MSEPPYNPPTSGLPGWTPEMEDSDPEPWEQEEVELHTVIASHSNWKTKLIKWLASQKRRINDLEDLANAAKNKADSFDTRIDDLEAFVALAQTTLQTINTKLNDFEARISALEASVNP